MKWGEFLIIRGVDLLYVNSNKSIKQILIKKMSFIVLIPLLLSSLSIMSFSYYYQYNIVEEQALEEAVRLGSDIEGEAVLINASVNLINHVIASDPTISYESILAMIRGCIESNKYITECSNIRSDLTILSYNLPHKNALYFSLNEPMNNLSITHYDGGSVKALPENIFELQRYNYRSDTLSWDISIFYPINGPHTWWMFALFLINLLLFIVVSRLFVSNIESSLRSTFDSLLGITREIGVGNYNFSLPVIEFTEFYHIAESFSIMADQIRSRERELHDYRGVLEERVLDRTKELSITVESLKDTQKQLIEAEKMASLGLLVSGISHEVNTPLGIIVTGASYLKEILEHQQMEFENKTTTTAGLRGCIEGAIESCDLVLGNSLKLSNLVKNFKMVARDQESDAVREFDAVEYVELIITNITQQYNGRPIDVKLICDRTFSLYTYPGALFKVISNLIINSYEFGFLEGEEGLIEIHLSQLEGNAEIIYGDNGRGMSRETMDKIFVSLYCIICFTVDPE